MKRTAILRRTPLKRSKAPNKVRKTSKSALKRKADTIFAEKIRAKGYCQLAGRDSIRCGGNLQCMHIVGRSNHSLRWDPINALCGCAGHHRYYTSHATEFAMLIEEQFPDRYEYLKEHRNEIWDKDIVRVLDELLDWKPSEYALV